MKTHIPQQTTTTTTTTSFKFFLTSQLFPATDS